MVYGSEAAAVRGGAGGNQRHAAGAAGTSDLNLNTALGLNPLANPHLGGDAAVGQGTGGSHCAGAPGAPRLYSRQSALAGKDIAAAQYAPQSPSAYPGPGYDTARMEAAMGTLLPLQVRFQPLHAVPPGRWGPPSILPQPLTTAPAARRR